MASQIAHIIYAEKFFSRIIQPDFESIISYATRKYLLDNKDEFYIGNVFPDIRRIDKNISRRDTHMYFEEINLNLEGLNAFEAGWKFHLCCDMKREEILGNYNFYSIKGTKDFDCIPPKLLEDEIFYDKFKNWEKMVYLFNYVPKINMSLVKVSHETFELWYAILAKYIEKKPDNKTLRIFCNKVLSSSDKAEKIVEAVKKIRENKKVLEILGKIYDEII